MKHPNQTKMQWHKLSPLAIVYFVIHFVVRFVKDGLLNIAPAAVIFVTQVEDKMYWGVLGAGVATTLLVVYAILFYLNFRYKLTEHEVVLRKGVFKKERITLNFAKIQNMNLAVPFYFQPFSLVNCTFDAAGSSQQEVGLPGIGNELANNMRTHVFAYKEQQSALPERDESELSATVDAEKPVMTLANFEVAKFGLMSGMMFLVLAAIAPFAEHVIDYSQDQFVGPLATFYSGFIDNHDVAMIVAAVTVVMVMIFAFVAASVLGALLRFYRFELYFENNKLKRISGLLERHQMSLSKDRIQAVEIKQNWIGMLLKRFILRCKQVENSHSGKTKKGQAFILPVLTKAQLGQAFALCWQACDVNAIPFQRISKRFWSKNVILFYLIPSSVLLSLFYMVSGNLFWQAYLAIIAFGSCVCWLRYLRYGIYTDGQQVFVRTGFIGKKITVFDIDKLQQISVVQTPLMKRHDLATLQVQLAAGRITVPYLNKSFVEQYMDIALYKAELKGNNWI